MENEKSKKIITGTAKRKKKNILTKFVNSFISYDKEDIKGYIIDDVVIPGIQKMIYNSITTFFENIFPSVGTKKSNSYESSRISYKSYYEKGNDVKQKTEKKYYYDEIIVDTKGEASSVLERMEELINTYNVVSVADYYDMLGISHDYTDNNYGWSDIHDAIIVKCMDGYMIKLPKAYPIN